VKGKLSRHTIIINDRNNIVSEMCGLSLSFFGNKIEWLDGSFGRGEDTRMLLRKNEDR
jgi:hypothetical protein